MAKLEERVRYGGRSVALGANRWRGGALEPRGFEYIAQFALEGTTPVWTFAFGEARLEKRVWMEQGAHTTYVSYRALRAGGPVELELRALVNYRDFHATTHAGDWQMDVSPMEFGACVRAFADAVPIFVRADRGGVALTHEWYRNYDLAAERARGLDDCEDHLHVATFTASLEPGEALTFVASLDAAASLDGDGALLRRTAYERTLLDAFDGEGSREAPEWIRALALAADQFVVNRPSEANANGQSVIAGYHWFGDWGRDTAIALAGLTLATGRASVAATILETFARYVDGGMLPNFFPDAGAGAEYNTVDAALWFVEAVRRYVDATNDYGLVARIFPVLADIIAYYSTGTRFGIRCDPADGLIASGAPGVALTWMDAKVGDWVVTPRIGKAIEVNALWYNALLAMDSFARTLGRPDATYERRAVEARRGFARYWNAERNYCYDVLDGPGGSDASVRPNAIFAVALTHSPLDPSQQRAVVDTCGRRLLTPAGLRTLDPDDPAYRPTYGGSPTERDGAYHQGTVWGWLLGPWVEAHFRVHGDASAGLADLRLLVGNLTANGIGTLGEIADGDAPNRANGCIAQAWTVAEVLRAWRTLDRAPRN